MYGSALLLAFIMPALLGRTTAAAQAPQGPLETVRIRPRRHLFDLPRVSTRLTDALPQFDEQAVGPLTTLVVPDGIGTYIYTNFSVATPPTPSPRGAAPPRSIAHLRPASSPNYVVADGGDASIEVTSYQNLIGFSFGCADRATGMLPGYPKACTLSVEVGCQDLDSPSLLPLKTQRQEFSFAPGVGDEAMVSASVAGLVLPEVRRNLDAVGTVPGYLVCPLTRFTATGLGGPVALYLDNVSFLY